MERQGYNQTRLQGCNEMGVLLFGLIKKNVQNQSGTNMTKNFAPLASHATSIVFTLCNRETPKLTSYLFVLMNYRFALNSLIPIPVQRLNARTNELIS